MLLLSDICSNRNLPTICNRWAKAWNITQGLITSVYPILVEGYVFQKNIYAWESLGIGKYVTALAILGPVYIILLFLTETNVLWELKARFSGFYKKGKLVSGSECNSLRTGQRAGSIGFFLWSVVAWFSASERAHRPSNLSWRQRGDSSCPGPPGTWWMREEDFRLGSCGSGQPSINKTLGFLNLVPFLEHLFPIVIQEPNRRKICSVRSWSEYLPELRPPKETL